MPVLVVWLLVQSLVQAPQTPVLEFPEAGLDDPAAYEGYTTRFFRDSRRNAFQIYLDSRSGRVVHVWADAANASAAFTVRDAGGRPAPLNWGGPGAAPSSVGDRRIMRHRLESSAEVLEVGWFLLGTMRQERDFQYMKWHERPYGGDRFVLSELSGVVSSLERLPAAERARHLAIVNAGGLEELQSRLYPSLTRTENGTQWAVLVEHTSLDGRVRMTIELRGDLAASTARLEGDVVSLQARAPGGIRFDVITTTDAPSLTPLDHGQIFNDAFDAFYAAQRTRADSVTGVARAADRQPHPAVTSFRHLERAVRGIELLSYEEKLMAALPNYATYFGRDMMMTALMLEPIASVELQERVIGSVLRKVASTGDVSHEEALGGQAIREGAAAYNTVIRGWEEVRDDATAAAERLAQARGVLEGLAVVRENYRMIDDDFQLPVLVDRYLGRSDVAPERKRRFLEERGADGRPQLDALVRNLALVAGVSRPYADDPAPTNLVSFQYRDEDGYFPGSWRDSRVGYGMGQFAMDVNVVWVPKGLEALDRILRELNALGLLTDDVLSRVSGDASALRAFRRDPTTLRAAIDRWRGARRHFEVRLDPNDVAGHVDGMLASMPRAERDYWRARAEDDTRARPLGFLALSLDSAGRPIAAANTDPATDLFLSDYTQEILRGNVDPEAVLQMLDVFLRPYPVGLFVEGLGPVVVNDAYASDDVQARFRGDLYHSPRVVWGREVNLLFIGLARQIAAAYDSFGRLRDDHEALRSYVGSLRRTLETTRRAVDASGMRHSELWSYRIEDGVLRPVRYGTSSDIQLWNLTDLSVRFLLDRLPPE